MANPTPDFPTSVHTPTDTSGFGNTKLGATTPKHTDVEGKQEEELKKINEKIGIGQSNAADAATGKVLKKQADGSTAWDTDATGVSDHGQLTGLTYDDHTQYMKKASNLSDVGNAATARTNLGVISEGDVVGYILALGG